MSMRSNQRNRRHIARFRQMGFILLLAPALMACPSPDDPDAGEITTPPTPPPAFLMTAWIDPFSEFGATTYDFTQSQAAGRYAVEITAWQRIGSLGWSSNQRYTADFTATPKSVAIRSATGHAEDWTLIAVESWRMLIQRGTQQLYLYNCNAAGWPSLIYNSMRACRAG